MESTKEKILNLAKKVNELANRGEGGELRNAQMMLKKLRNKHNITIEEINRDQKKEYFIKYKRIHKGLTINLIAHVCGDIDTYSYKNKKILGFFIECTPFEFIELTALINFYTNEYDRQCKIFEKAFIVKNRIMIKDAKVLKHTEMTKQDWEILEMMRGVKKRNYQRQLNK